MKRIVLLLFILISPAISYSQELPAYRLFDAEGDEQDFGELSDMALEADVIFFGELHNNAIAHWLQLELAKYLADETMNNLIIGAEMFESDNQLLIDEYFAGLIPQKNFEQEVRLWKNYKTDYKPVVEFAKDNGLRFIATNIPRRYAAFVARNGLDSLSEFGKNAQEFFPPLPIEVDLEIPAYKKMSSMMGDASHGMSHIVEAQAVKDATMGYFIAQNFEKGKKFLHLNGSFHSDDYSGILWFLKRHKPELKVMTISTVNQDDIEELEEEHYNKADLIIAVPTNMTNTH